MTSILLPTRSSLDSILVTHATTSSLDATFALGPSVFGPIIETPHSLSVRTFLATPGFLYMASCIAGATATGRPWPMATVAIDVTVPSSIPLAIFDMVLAVAG